MNSSLNAMYSKLSNMVFGFHGCDKETFDNVLYKHQQLKISDNAYDWLGNGMYFWENSYQRAYDWAKTKYKSKAAVIGAVIDLGICLNLTDYNSTEILQTGYEILKSKCEILSTELPRNKNTRDNKDLLLRDLDCAVIQQIHEYNKLQNNGSEFDSVRGVFIEGNKIYPNSGFVEKTHIQLCIVNPNCIKGYFNPLEYNDSYRMP